jgi:two-component system CheB/CheR fusion protein
MAKEGLSFEIRNALHKAKITSETSIKKDIPINEGKKLVTLEVIPLLNMIDLHFLILFRDGPVITDQRIGSANHASNIEQHKYDTRIKQLEKELSQAREDMRSITEEQEAANEELQSANEELLSGSEELQSLNEEMETSKEELQSTNEELITVNQELFDRNEELNHIRKFAETTISILHEPLLVLDKYFRIKNANISFYKIFKLSEEETLGKIIFELQDNSWDIPGLRKKLVKIQDEKEKAIEMEIAFTFPVIGERTICFNIQPIHGGNDEQLILLALDDITLRKNAEHIQTTARNLLERNAKMIQNLYMNAPGFICIFNGPKHIYTLVNPSYQKLIGKRKIVGKPVMEALPELAGQGFDTILDNVYNTGEIYVGNEILISLARDEGLLPEDRYFNFSYQPIYNDYNKIDGILVFGYEVTEQFVAKKQVDKNMRLLLESISQITITASPEGNITFYNKYYLDYTGLTLEEATAIRGWKKIIHPEDLRKALEAGHHSMATGEDFYFEMRLKRKRDGIFRWHLARATAIKDNDDKIISWVGAATDIHDQKMKEQKKDEFISIASHEMKTPLTTVKGYLQLLEMELSSNKDNELSFLYAKKASLSVTRLNDLISELLDVSKIKNGKLNYNFTFFNFDEMVENAIENMQYSSPFHTIIKTGSIGRNIFGDKDRLQQVVINLLSNAIKYSPSADKVFINISFNNGKVKVSIKDTGIGIAKNDIDQIFERYYRVAAHALQFQGLGIGLFISYEIIQRHQGKLWAESELGKGSTFYFTLPIKPLTALAFNKST